MTEYEVMLSAKQVVKVPISAESPEQAEAAAKEAAEICFPLNWETQACEAHAEPVTTDCTPGRYEVTFNVLKVGKVVVDAESPADARDRLLGLDSDWGYLGRISRQSMACVTSISKGGRGGR